MLATLIQSYDKKSFNFWSSSKTRAEIYRLSGATFYDCIKTPIYKFIKPFFATFYDCINTPIYKFIKPFLNNKMSIFEEYVAFK